MAILGGAGNPVGGSFTGPAEALEIIGNHAYAYSGEKAIAASSSANTTMIKFTSGNFYFVGTIAWANDNAASADVYIDLKLNGAVIWTAQYSSAIQSLQDQPLSIIIPAYTEFEGILGSDTNENMTMMMSGRIYRG